MTKDFTWILAVFACGFAGSGCGGAGDSTDDGADDDTSAPGDGTGGGTNVDEGDPVIVTNPLTDPEEGPAAGNPEGACDVPESAAPGDVSSPRTVVGDGTAASCTGDAVINAVAAGGVITFACGPEPIVITLDRPAKIVNDTGPEIIIDGGGLVTLSGGGQTRILYMNTCDEAQKWTTAQCDNQDHPRLTAQNITFVDGNAAAAGEALEGGGGAIFARGGRLKLVNTRFFNNVCAPVGQDVGGGAVRAYDQYNHLPLYVVNSTFGGEEGLGNSCSNGGGISSIGVSWTVINSLFSYNHATGNGANPAEAGTPGGGSGGGIYNDGNTMTLTLCGTRISHNEVNAHGAGVFFVTNDHSGDIVINQSVISENVGGSWYVLPGISMHDDTQTTIDDVSVLE